MSSAILLFFFEIGNWVRCRPPTPGNRGAGYPQSRFRFSQMGPKFQHWVPLPSVALNPCFEGLFQDIKTLLSFHND
jgi:hypothetical protein